MKSEHRGSDGTSRCSSDRLSLCLSDRMSGDNDSDTHVTQPDDVTQTDILQHCE